MFGPMSEDAKTAVKTALAPADGVRRDKLGRPLVGWAVDGSKRGRGPAKGAPNAGRPPDEWKAKLRAIASREDVLQHIESVLTAGPDHPFFARALEYVTEYGYGKATQHIEQNGATTLEIVVRHE
jgi:hypothetical protein